MPLWSWYLIGINIIGFAGCFLTLRGRKGADGQRNEMIPVVLSLMAGSGGVLLAKLFFDRKPVKENMLSGVVAVCAFIVQTLVTVMLHALSREHITFAFWELFTQNTAVWIYIAAVNVLSLVLFGIDKMCAVKGWHRIRIVTLLGSAFIGGSVGALVGMYLFRHKTKKNYFAVGVPLILFMQIVVCVFLVNL